jgi:hypothetical protein
VDIRKGWNLTMRVSASRVFNARHMPEGAGRRRCGSLIKSCS